MKENTDPLICWLDLETSGLDWNADLILEVAAVMTRSDLRPIDTFESLVRPITADWQELLDPVVRDLHETSGLLAALNAEPRPGSMFRPGRSVVLVGDELEAWIRSHTQRHPVEDRDEHVYLGGSGVSHFDRRWLERWWPKVEALFHRRTVDIGIVRQYLDFFTEIGAPVTQAPNRPHRALADVMTILDECRIYRDDL